MTSFINSHLRDTLQNNSICVDYQKNVFNQDKREEQSLNHEGAGLADMMTRALISSRSFELETLFNRNYSDVDETVGENVDHCNL